jgi:hypothetical protein
MHHVMEDSEKIELLEKKLDEALAKVFELESLTKRDGLVRYELEEIIRSIYRECRNILKNEEEKKPTVDQVLTHLSENIRKMAKEYRIDL